MTTLIQSLRILNAEGERPVVVRVVRLPHNDPACVLRFAKYAERVGRPYSDFTVREIHGINSPEQHSEDKGNFDTILGDCEEKLLARLEEALGVTFTPVNVL